MTLLTKTFAAALTSPTQSVRDNFVPDCLEFAGDVSRRINQPWRACGCGALRLHCRNLQT